jgi:hypothetical protein
MDVRCDEHGQPILDQFSEEGFVDLTFRIEARALVGDFHRLQLRASHDAKIVGMELQVRSGIRAGLDNDMKLIPEHVYRNGVRFVRSGPESDHLIAAIAVLYGADPEPRSMVPQETFTAIALHQGALDWDNAGVRLKLFGKDGEPFDEDAYYESFLTVDLGRGLVLWNEKDPDYRLQLLRALVAA